MIRARRGRRKANPQRRGFLAGLILSCLPVCAHAMESGEPSTIEFYIAAFAELERHEFAALGLTLGILCFAVVNAIMLVRSRRQAAEADGFFREQIASLSADVDRAQALLLSEPQIVVAWAAASDQPEIIGDAAIVSAAGDTQRVLAFGLWLPADQALADKARTSCNKHGLHDTPISTLHSILYHCYTNYSDAIEAASGFLGARHDN